MKPHELLRLDVERDKCIPDRIDILLLYIDVT